MIIFIKNLDDRLNNREKRLFYFFIFIYPLIAILLKFTTQYILQNVNSGPTYIGINSMEHILAGIGVGVIIYPFIKNSLQKLNFIEKAVFFIPLIVFSCFLYELISFLFFYQYLPYGAFNLYYDTMRDLAMNLVGAVISFLLLMKKE